MKFFSWLVALALGLGSAPVAGAALPLATPGDAGSQPAGVQLPQSDLRTDPVGREWLEHFVGGTSWESFGAGGIQACSNAAYRADAERAAQAAARSLPEITSALGIPPRAILPMWILVSPRAEGFAREAPTWSAAIAQPEKRLIVLSGPSLRSTVMDPDETVAHEIAHLALHARIGEMGWVPRWFDEGLAMRLSGYSRWRDRLASIGRGRVNLHELADQFPQEPGLARQAYVESEAAVRRMEDLGPIAPLLDRLAAGEDFEPAFEAVYGESFDDFSMAVQEEVPAVWRILATVRGTVLLWAFGALLVVLGAWRVRLRNRRRMREWEAAESAASGAEAPPATEGESSADGDEQRDSRSV